MKHILSIAGSDSSCGAGIQADLKTFMAHGAYGLSVLTSITAQNTKGVLSSENVSARMIKTQLEAIFDDVHVDAIKIGMLSCVETIQEVVKVLDKYPDISVVLDTIMISSSGFRLLDSDAMDIFTKKLIPKATLITPNIPEAMELSKMNITNIDDMKSAAKQIRTTSKCKNILLKGGHLKNDVTDVLYDGDRFTLFAGKKRVSNNTHGTGCALSSAIAVNLAKDMSLVKAIKKAKNYVSQAIEHGFGIGSGVGQLNHFCKGLENE